MQLFNNQNRLPKALFAGLLISPLFYKVSFGEWIIVHPIAFVLGIIWVWIIYQARRALQSQSSGMYVGEWQCWNIQAFLIALLAGGLALSQVLSDLREGTFHEQGWLLWVKFVLYWAPFPLAAILAFRVGAEAVKLACYLLPSVGIITIGYSFYRLRNLVGERYSQAYIDSSPEHQAMGMLGEVLTWEGLVAREDTVSQGAYGIYLVFVSLFSLILALFSHKRIGGVSVRYAQMQAWVVIPLAVIALLFTASRTSFVLMLMVLSCLIGLAIWNPGSVLSASRYKVMGGLLTFIAFVSCIWFSPISIYVPTIKRMVGTVEYFDSGLQITDNKGDALGEIRNIDSRLWVWRQAVNYLIAHPQDFIFGIGYDRTVYRDLVLEGDPHVDALINTSHNIYLDMLIKGGIVTFTALVALCMLVVWWTMVSVLVKLQPSVSMDLKAVSWFFLCFWVPFLVINLWSDELITDNAMVHWTSMFGLMVGLWGTVITRGGLNPVFHISATASVGGGPLYITALIRDQIKKGKSVSVVTTLEKPYVDIWKSMGIGVYPILVRKAKLVPVIRLVKILMDKPSLVHAHGRGAAFYALWPKLLLRIPVAYTPHGPHYIGERSVRKVFALSFEYVILGLFDTVIYVSHGELELAKKHWFPITGARVVVSGFIENSNGCKLSYRDRGSIRQALGITDNTFVIGWIGRFHYQKGVDVLLDSIPDVAREVQEAVWVIVGNGSGKWMEHKLYHGPDDKISRRVFFMGEVPEAARLIPAFDMYISTSRWEGLPLVLLEVLNQGKAVVATDVPGNRDVLQGWGYLFPPDSPLEAAKAQIWLARNKTLREDLGKKGTDVLGERFAAERMFREIDCVYKRMMSL